MSEELKEAVEHMHGGTATLAQPVPTRESFEGNIVWEGVVHVFDLVDHPTATRAYAWSSPIEGSTKRRFFAVLHQSPVDSPQAAVMRRSWRSTEANESAGLEARTLDRAVRSLLDRRHLWAAFWAGEEKSWPPVLSFVRALNPLTSP
jgi:hypothetical protein